MAVREYIGARYVPKFGITDAQGNWTIQWAPAREYEALTVMQYEGDSYISIQPVPSGIQITNREYWLLTYQFNAQYGSLKTSVDSNSASIATLKTKVSTLEKDSLDNAADIEETQAVVKAINEDVEALKSTPHIEVKSPATEGSASASLLYPLQLTVMNDTYTSKKAVLALSAAGEFMVNTYRDASATVPTNSTVFKDPIVEFGTKNGWYYEKHKNGVLKCWKRQVVTFSGDSAWEAKIDYPEPIKSAYCATATPGDYRVNRMWTDPMADNGQSLWIGANSSAAHTSSVNIAVVAQV